ncbi:MAG: HNH endonuclease [Myxococcales bacterium]
MAPLTEDLFEMRFTAPRALRDKLRQAQDLLRHRTRSGALAVVFDKALDALIVNLKKERFAVGTKARNPAAPAESTSWSRNIPDAIKRAVYERAQGRCEFVGDDGRRCSETGGLELDHVEGFARTHVHSVEGIRLLCHVHNLLAAEQMYGRAFMDRVRRELAEARASAARKTPLSSPPVGARPGAKGQRSLF